MASAYVSNIYLFFCYTLADKALPCKSVTQQWASGGYLEITSLVLAPLYALSKPRSRSIRC